MLRHVTLTQSQELVSLANLGPRQGTFEETLGVLGHRRSLQSCAALDALGRLHGVGSELSWVVGGAAAPRLSLMDLDQLAPVVEAYQEDWLVARAATITW